MKHRCGLRYKCILPALPYLVGAMLIFTGCSGSNLKPGDTVVPPVPSNASQGGTAAGAGTDKTAGTNGAGSTSSVSNINSMNGINALTRPSTDMVYDLIDSKTALLSVFADSKYFYLLRQSAEPAGRKGGKDVAAAGEEAGAAVGAGTDAKTGLRRGGRFIEVYDVENASLVRRITDGSLDACSAFTVKDSNLYAFDAQTGRIVLFSSSGSLLASYDTGLSGVEASKIAVAGNRRMILEVRQKPGEDSKLAVYDMDAKSTDIVDASQLSGPSQGRTPEIGDFCLYGEDTLLVSLLSGRLCLFDTGAEVVRKSCVFPSNVQYIQFDGNVLYYASDGQISLNPGNMANFSNTGNPRFIGRLLVNGEFSWPEAADELEASFLDDLQIPYADGGRHYGMAQNSRYLFFLDLVPAQPGDDGKGANTEFLLYRIAK